MTTEEMENKGLNTCDCCGFYSYSNKLIWTEYDLEDKVINNQEVFNYTALCLYCFMKLNKQLIKNK